MPCKDAGRHKLSGPIGYTKKRVTSLSSIIAAIGPFMRIPIQISVHNNTDSNTHTGSYTSSDSNSFTHIPFPKHAYRTNAHTDSYTFLYIQNPKQISRFLPHQKIQYRLQTTDDRLSTIDCTRLWPVLSNMFALLMCAYGYGHDGADAAADGDGRASDAAHTCANAQRHNDILHATTASPLVDGASERSGHQIWWPGIGPRR